MSNKPKTEKKPAQQGPKRIAQVAKAGRRSKTGGKNAGLGKFGADEAIIPTTVVTVEQEELISGSAATGHNVKVGDATFGVTEGGRRVILVAATDELGKYVGKFQDVFLTLRQIVASDFDTNHPLKGVAGEKQTAMWQHIRKFLGEDSLQDLKERLDRESGARHEMFIAEREATQKAAQFVGENIDVWNGSVTGSDATIAAFANMAADRPAEIRFGNMNVKDADKYGVVLGFFFDTRTDGMTVQVGHVGEKSEFAGKIIAGTHLRCPVGKVPEVLSESILAGHLGGSIKVIHEIVLGMDRAKGARDALMSGMYYAAKRLTTERRTKVVAINSKQQPLHAVLMPAPVKVAEVPAEQPTVAAEQPAPAKVTAQVATHAANVQDNGLNAAVAALVMACATPELIAQTIAAYQAIGSQANTKSA